MPAGKLRVTGRRVETATLDVTQSGEVDALQRDLSALQGIVEIYNNPADLLEHYGTAILAN